MLLAIHVLLALLMPPLLQGVIIKTKARFAGRQGPPLLQPYYDLIKLMQKGFVFSATTTWLFPVGTAITLAATAVAALVIPLGHHDAPLAFAGDMILFAYVFALARFFLTLTSLDTGSAFEGMGAAREVTFACLAEPTLFFGLLVLANVSGSSSLSDVFGAKLLYGWEHGSPSLPLVLVAWFITALAENCRIPFDDPNTHLELTMIHEVIVLDHGGPVLGMMLYAAALKLFIFGALVVRVAVPLATGHAVLDWGIFVVALLAFALLVGVIESIMARLRMTEIPKLLATACVLSALALLLRVS
jgi:formate hydrogenlyase subunit 4